MTGGQQQNFSELFQLAIGGEEPAIRELIQRYGSIVSGEAYASLATQSPEISQQDVSQEIWLRVCHRLRSFEGADDEKTRETMFRSWLRVTARNVAQNMLEKRQAQKRGGGRIHRDVNSQPLPSDDKTPSSVVSKDEIVAMLSERVDELEPEMKQILRMRFFEGMSLDAIATKMNLSTDSLRYRLSKTLTFLKKQIKE